MYTMMSEKHWSRGSTCIQWCLRNTDLGEVHVYDDVVWVQAAGWICRPDRGGCNIYVMVWLHITLFASIIRDVKWQRMRGGMTCITCGGVLTHVIWQKLSDILKEPAAPFSVYLEYGGSTFLWNFGIFIPDYRASQYRRQRLSMRM